jgi:hypothetical protein
MIVMTQEEYKEYRQNLKEQGYCAIESKCILPGHSPWGKSRTLLQPSDTTNFIKELLNGRK